MNNEVLIHNSWIAKIEFNKSYGDCIWVMIRSFHWLSRDMPWPLRSLTTVDPWWATIQQRRFTWSPTLGVVGGWLRNPAVEGCGKHPIVDSEKLSFWCRISQPYKVSCCHSIRWEIHIHLSTSLMFTRGYFAGHLVTNWIEMSKYTQSMCLLACLLACLLGDVDLYKFFFARYLRLAMIPFPLVTKGLALSKSRP